MNRKDLRNLLHYDLETGIFKWKKYKKGCRRNLIAGTLTKKGYIRIKISNSTPVMAHRLAFLYVLGYMPEEVDHADHDRANNKWINLENSSSFKNGRNLSLNKNNKLKITGVYYIEERKCFVAKIRNNDSQLYIGSSVDFFEACCARKSAENKYNYHENHGK